jgi:ABC-2 type transport system permease protein
MWERTFTILVKEFIQTLREPRARGLLFIAPMIQLLVFGYAATMDVHNAATAIVDLDNTPRSRDFLDRFTESGYFQAVARLENEAEAQGLLESEDAVAMIRINHGFAEDLDAGRTASVQMLVDGTNSSTGNILLSYGARIAARFSQQVQMEQFRRQRGAARFPGQVELQNRVWFNENLETRLYYVPGVMANLAMLVALMLTSMAVVRERELGTMEQIMVTPIRRWEFIVGKTVPFVILGYANVLIVTVVGVFWFDVPIRGSFLLLLAAAGLYLLSGAGLGLLVSTVCQTQQQAMLSTFFIFFPLMLLSGFSFPVANMPEVIQWLTYLNPLRYFLIVIRGIFLKGVGFDTLWDEMAAMAAIGVGLIVLATRRLHKTTA